MSQPLIGAGQLIKESWNTFTSTWDTTVRYSAWFVLVTLLSIAPLFLPSKVPLLDIIAFLLTVALAIWVSIRVYQVVLALERKEKVTNKTTATVLTLFWPLVWVSILTGLATIGGLILLILPGIYIGVRMGFSQLFVIDEKKKGTDAIKASWELTKQKFWPVFGRQLAGGIVFGGLMLIIIWIAVRLVALIANIDFNEVFMDSESGNPYIVGSYNLIQGIVQAAFIPLFYIFQVKLFKSLGRVK